MTQVAHPKPEVGEAIGRIPSGVFIVTAQHQDKKAGMLASWVMQVGFEPPTISVAVHPERELYHVIQASNTFTVNVISKSHHHLMKAFGHYTPEQFNGLDALETGYGITLNDSIAVMECRVKTVVDESDHHLLIAEVVNGKMLHPDVEPMVHLRKSGFSY